MTRSERRHRAERAKARARRYYGRWHMKPGIAPEQRSRLLGIYARSPKVCSRWCCGNPRKHFHHRTPQETRNAPGRMTPEVERRLVVESDVLAEDIHALLVDTTDDDGWHTPSYPPFSS